MLILPGSPSLQELQPGIYLLPVSCSAQSVSTSQLRPQLPTSMSTPHIFFSQAQPTLKSLLSYRTGSQDSSATALLLLVATIKISALPLWVTFPSSNSNFKEAPTTTTSQFRMKSSTWPTSSIASLWLVNNLHQLRLKLISVYLSSMPTKESSMSTLNKSDSVSHTVASEASLSLDEELKIILFWLPLTNFFVI